MYLLITSPTKTIQIHPFTKQNLFEDSFLNYALRLINQALMSTWFTSRKSESWSYQLPGLMPTLSILLAVLTYSQVVVNSCYVMTCCSGIYNYRNQFPQRMENYVGLFYSNGNDLQMLNHMQNSALCAYGV